MFERLYTLDDARNPKFQGSGLGLSVGKCLTEAMKGEMQLSSKPYENSVHLFLSLGIQKISGHQLQVDIFKSLNLPQWFRFVTGWVELVGVVGLIVGFWLPWVVVIAGLWFGITMLIGMIAHVRVKDPFSKSIPAFVLLVISVTLSTLNF